MLPTLERDYMNFNTVHTHTHTHPLPYLSLTHARTHARTHLCEDFPLLKNVFQVLIKSLILSIVLGPHDVA